MAANRERKSKKMNEDGQSQDGFKDKILALLASGLFDGPYYRVQCAQAQIEENCDSDLDLLFHYLQTGWVHGLDPSRAFSTERYLAAYPEVVDVNANPLLHYVLYGQAEGRRRFRVQDPAPRNAGHPRFAAYQLISDSGLFDPAYYVQSYPEVASADDDPLWHYIEHGSDEDRNPSQLFDTDFYRRSNAEILRKQPDILPLEHYIKEGRALGKAVRPSHGVTLDRAAQVATKADGSVRPGASYAIHAHLYYASLALDILALCTSLDTCAHFYFTTPNEVDAHFFRRYIESYHPVLSERCDIIVFPNRGRDVAPFIVGLADEWQKYDYWCHLHTKYPPHVAFGHEWRAYLLDANIGSRQRVADILAMFEQNKNIGLLYPDHYYQIKRSVAAKRNEEAMAFLAARAPLAENAHFDDFPAGSMFWARKEALRPLFKANLALNDFGPEGGEIEATVAHAIERGFPLAAIHAGYAAARFYAYPASERALSMRRKTAAEETEAVGTRWRRDDPAIAKGEPQPLAPFTRAYNPNKFVIHWIIPDFRKGAGGHMTIFRFVAELSKRGHDQTVWIQNCHNHPSPAAALARIREWYRPLGDNVLVRFLPDDVRGISGDVVIATDCWTAFPCAQMTGFKKRFYFVQDYEPLFHPVGDLYYTALSTYQFGFTALCAGKWLEAIASSHGMETYRWDLAVDHDVYRPDQGRRNSTTPEIAFYARKYTPRRLVGMGMAALDILAESKERFHITFFGEDLEIGAKNYPYTCLGVADSADLADLYNRATIGLVMSGTNYSLVPLEMMACGLPVVDIDVESTRAAYPEDCAALAAPNPVAIAKTLKALLASPKRRAELAGRAQKFAGGLDWRSSVSAVERAIAAELAKEGRPVEIEPLAKPFVKSSVFASVLIPTLNGGAAFAKVLDRVLRQKASFDYDVVVIDSNSVDETGEILDKFARQDRRLTIYKLNQAEFQHGRTRDLGIEACRGGHVALLTQDALPATDEWLDRLVGAFELDPLAAFVFGRHHAYPHHSLYTQEEIKAHFDWIYSLGNVFSRNGRLPSALARGLPGWEQLMAFNSDNNTCVRKDVWREIRYPHIAWGEDQLWSKICMDLGFKKIYADAAGVFHSHDFSALKHYDVAFEEGRLFRQFLGLDLVPSGAVLADLIAEKCRTDKARAPDVKLPQQRMALHAATVLGRTAGQYHAREFLLDKLKQLIEITSSNEYAPAESEFRDLFKKLNLA